MKGFGMVYDTRSGGFRNWYIDGDGAKRWADNDQLVTGYHAQRDDEPREPMPDDPTLTPATQ